MLHDFLEDYVNDIVVKSKEVHNHVNHWREVFKRWREYKLIMNPLICIFNVFFGKFLGFTVHRKQIDLNPVNVEPFNAMEPSITCKKLKIFMGRVSYVHRHSCLGWDSRPIVHSCLRRMYHSNEARSSIKCFKGSKTCSTHLWQRLLLPRFCFSLSSSTNNVGASLHQEVQGAEHHVYYQSISLQGVELNYFPVERHSQSDIRYIEASSLFPSSLPQLGHKAQ